MATRAKNRGENRPNRVPVSGRRDVMTVADKDESYVYRWVNDTENRINLFEQGGYELVHGDIEVGTKSVDSSSSTSSVVSKNVGGGVTAYLMRIKREWYEEDRIKAAKTLEDGEADMKRTLNSGKDGTYGKVEIS